MRKKKQYPDKKTLNLMVMERTGKKLGRATPAIVVAAILILLFSKFAVADRLIAADRAKSAADAAEKQLADIDAQLVDYNDVLLEYSRYFSDGLGVGKDVMPLDCMEVLNIMHSYVMDRVDISTLTFSDDTVTVQITGVTLEEASTLMSRLDSLPEVAGVNLYTANTPNAARTVTEADDLTAYNAATILLTVTFQQVFEEEVSEE